MATFADAGKYAEYMLKGNLFVYHVPAQALLLSATTGGHPTLINPTGSGRVFVPVALRLCFVSGTTVIGSVLLAETLNAGGGAATGAAIVTATLAAAARTARRGFAGNSNMQWSPTTNTFTAAPTVIAATGMNLGAASPTGTGEYSVNFDGTLGFEPGTAVSIVYSVTTSTALFQVTMWGIELPSPSL